MEMCGYILENMQIKKVPLIEAAKWFECLQNRVIDRTDIEGLSEYPGGRFISTVFLCFNHNFEEHDWKENPPVLFETMVFGGEYDQRMWRYSTLMEAKQGHWAIVDCIRNGRRPSVAFGERPIIDMFWEELENRKNNEGLDDE